MDHATLIEKFNRLGRPRVVLVGDFMLDEYVYGDVERINPEAPVIMITAFGSAESAVEAMKLGAYDYISKPFSARELAARLRAILRRAAPFEGGERAPLLAFGPIAVDLDMHTARVDGQVVELTRREFELLAYFLANPRRVLTREKILQQVWGLEYLGESRTIDAHVRRVRAKIGEAAADLIETVVGVGYRLGGPADS